MIDLFPNFGNPSICYMASDTSIDKDTLTPPYLELLDGLEGVSTVGEGLLEVHTTGDADLLQAKPGHCDDNSSGKGGGNRV